MKNVLKISFSGENNYSFYSIVEADTIVICFKQLLCRYSPLLRPGYLSPGIKIEEIKFDKHHNSTQVYQTTTIVKAETTGQKKVCLQIYNEQRCL